MDKIISDRRLTTKDLYNLGKTNLRMRDFILGTSEEPTELVKGQRDLIKADIKKEKYAAEWAVKTGNIPALKSLMYSIDKYRGYYSDQLFMDVGKYGHLDMLKFSIRYYKKYGYAINSDISYAFVYAAMNGQKEIIDYLLDNYDINILARNFQGGKRLYDSLKPSYETVLYIFKNYNHPERLTWPSDIFTDSLKSGGELAKVMLERNVFEDSFPIVWKVYENMMEFFEKKGLENIKIEDDEVWVLKHFYELHKGGHQRIAFYNPLELEERYNMFLGNFKNVGNTKVYNYIRSFI